MKIIKFIMMLLMVVSIHTASGQASTDIPQPTNPPADIKCGQHKIIRGVPFKNIEFCGTKEQAKAFRQVLKVLLNKLYTAFPGLLDSMFNCDNSDCPTVQCVKDVHVYEIHVTIPYYIGNGCYRLQVKPHIRATCSTCDEGVKPNDDDPPLLACGEHGVFEHTLASSEFKGSSDQIETMVAEMTEILYEYYSIFTVDLNNMVACKDECREGEECESNVNLGGISHDISENPDGSVVIDFNAELEGECSSCERIQNGGADINIRNDDVLSKVKIHPNPNHGIFTLDLSDMEVVKPQTIEVFDLYGTSVYRMSIDGNQELIIDISEMPRGFYYLMVRSEHTKYVIEKLILE